MCPSIYIVLPSYMVMAFLGGMAAVFFLYFRTEKFEIEFNSFIKMLVASVIGVIVGSKVMFFISRVPSLVTNFSIENLLGSTIYGGYVFYGGLFGMIISILIMTRKNKENRAKYFSFLVPVMPLFHAFGRVGCFMSGCCYGKELPSAFEVCGVVIDRIPVQLIEAVFELIMFVVLTNIVKKSPKANALRVYLLSYATFRFIIEFFRGDILRGVWFGISLAQWISIGIFVYYIVRGICKKKGKE